MGIFVKDANGQTQETRTNQGADGPHTQVVQGTSDGMIMRLLRVFQNFTFSFPGTVTSALNVSLLGNQSLGTVSSVNTVGQCNIGIGDMGKYVTAMQAQSVACNTGIYQNFKRV